MKSSIKDQWNMCLRMGLKLLVLSFCCLLNLASTGQKKHVFSLSKEEFLLDGKPFQIISGEMHPARIPREYWAHRIRMAKAMGCNTIAVYVFWNYQEINTGKFDFQSGNKDISAFIKLCQQEGMWVLLRPGPYVCAEWDFGGMPSYLLKVPDIKLRCSDPRYMAAVNRYINRLSKEVVPLLCTNGGPILMVQVENEYGSYSNDRQYLQAIKSLWTKNGVNVPFYTADGPAAYLLESGSLEGCAIGLDSGSSDADFAAAKKQNPDVPAFSSETYPGWLTHWGEKWQHPDTAGLLNELRYLLSHKRSFNLYVIHGGTNFGYTAGANAFTPAQYQPDVTSYDYDAPVNEQGQPTPKYYAIRNLIQQYVSHPLPAVPASVPVISIEPFAMQPFTSIWNELPKPVLSPQPVPMEKLDQKSGLVLYRTKLIGPKSGKLTITEPHDFALIYLDGKLIDTIYRDGGKWTIDLPPTQSKQPVLDIMVEAMGHINFAQYMIDRKGITERVTLNGITLTNWQIFSLPFDDNFVMHLQPKQFTTSQRGIFFKGNFELKEAADTYLDMSKYHKGVVWVNGHNLGRFWNKGPQFRLYCPAGWLNKGDNEVRVLDLLQEDAAPLKGVSSLY